MIIKRKFPLVTVAVLICVSVVFAQQVKIPIFFEVIIIDKKYDGTNVGGVKNVFFKKTEDMTSVSGFMPFDPTDPTMPYDYKVESVIYNGTDVDLVTEAAVRITLKNTLRTDPYTLGSTNDTTIVFPAKISKEKSYIVISCNNVVSGNKPIPVIDTMNLYYDLEKPAFWRDSAWITDNIVWRYSLMNMEMDTSNHIQKPDGEADPYPAWVSQAPTTTGTYWVQAIFKGNANYIADTCKYVVFNISQNSVAIKTNFAKQNSLAFAGIINHEINLSLKTGFYTLEMYNLQGRLVSSVELNAKDGINATGLKVTNLSKGMFVLNVKQAGISVLQQKIMMK